MKDIFKDFIENFSNFIDFEKFKTYNENECIPTGGLTVYKIGQKFFIKECVMCTGSAFCGRGDQEGYSILEEAIEICNNINVNKYNYYSWNFERDIHTIEFYKVEK